MLLQMFLSFHSRSPPKLLTVIQHCYHNYYHFHHNHRNVTNNDTNSHQQDAGNDVDRSVTEITTITVKNSSLFTSITKTTNSIIIFKFFFFTRTLILLLAFYGQPRSRCLDEEAILTFYCPSTSPLITRSPGNRSC